ncbi:MAG: uncharacterized protein QOD42_2597 [Sphingomonadales bacterium]|jgi:uncharacterized protein YggE|nr:uncharacterized protein [Sphingomonadales bacterium]
MRLLLACLSIGLALAMPARAGVPPLGSATASSPVRVQPLAPGELLLELGTIGMATAPADAASVAVTLAAEGATPGLARAALVVLERRATEVARGAGAPAAGISRRTVPTFEVNDAPLAMEEGTVPGPPPPPTYRAGSSLMVRVPQIARLEPVRRALGTVETARVSQPVYTLTDSGPARRAARAEAMARIRADAEMYAGALNMRVLRIVRITERTGSDLFGLALSEGPALMRRGFNPDRQGDPDVNVAVMVGVDFALGPR